MRVISIAYATCLAEDVHDKTSSTGCGSRARARSAPIFAVMPRRISGVSCQRMIDGRPAVLVCDADDPASPPRYFVLLDWRGERHRRHLRLFFARYAMDGARVLLLR